MYGLLGVFLALAVAATAWQRSRTHGGFYDVGVYGMTPGMHRRYLVISLVFAAAFVLSFGLHAGLVAMLLLGAYVLIAILYFTSFLRGACDE